MTAEAILYALIVAGIALDALTYIAIAMAVVLAIALMICRRIERKQRQRRAIDVGNGQGRRVTLGTCPSMQAYRGIHEWRIKGDPGSQRMECSLCWEERGRGDFRA